MDKSTDGQFSMQTVKLPEGKPGFEDGNWVMENWNFGIYDSPWIGMWHGEQMTWSALNGALVKWGSNYLEFWGNHNMAPTRLLTPALRGLEIWNDAVQQESDMNHLYKCHFQLDKIRSSHVLNTSTPISWGSRFNFNEMFPGSFQRILGSSYQFNQHFLKSCENSSSGTQGPPIRI